jgi:hypothetical protein
MADISPQVGKVNMKAKKSKPRRKTFSSILSKSKSNRSTKLFSDDSAEELETTKATSSPLHNPIVNAFSKAIKSQQKGIINKRKPSQSPTFCEEPETSCLPSLPDQSKPSHSLHRQPGERGDGDFSDQDLGEVETVLIWTKRVLEMIARRGEWEPQQREMWEEIRRIAEREEGRELGFNSRGQQTSQPSVDSYQQQLPTVFKQLK